MSSFVILGRKLDENDLDQILDFHPGEIHRVPLVLLIDSGKFGAISSADFAKEFEFLGTFGRLRGVRRGVWPRGFGRLLGRK